MLLANCSHELRTPLARIRMGLELAGAGADPARRAALGKDIAELDALIDEILLASRLDAQKSPEHRDEVDLLALAAEEAARFDLAAEGKALAVRGEPALLRRMVRNLIENARRHGGDGPIAVTVGAEPAGAGVRLEVADNGPGVPEAEREKIFAPFYRLAGAEGGSGLGLALVREIARRHGGDAHCLAGRGAGSVFRVVLPAAARPADGALPV
jgi:signal transduction histidine kinase